jgi:hypothetical protein
MKHNVMLTIAPLLSILFMTFHLTEAVHPDSCTVLSLRNCGATTRAGWPREGS